MSAISNSRTELVLNETFFDQLWPLILEENVCDTHSKNTSPFFVPLRPFDQIWAHNLLARKDYGQYEPPIDFLCQKSVCSAEEDEVSCDKKRALIELDDGFADKCEFGTSHRIKGLNQHIAEINMQQKWRENLAHAFINRNHPWHMPKPSYEFELTDDLLSVFAQPFERGLLRAIHVFNCRFLVINLSSEICWLLIEKWVKFCGFLNILIIVHKEELVKKLIGLNQTIMTMMFAQNLENTWQQELTRALDQAVTFATSNKLMENCDDSFIYVFSSHLDGEILDRFRVLRRI